MPPKKRKGSLPQYGTPKKRKKEVHTATSSCATNDPYLLGITADSAQYPNTDLVPSGSDLSSGEPSQVESIVGKLPSKIEEKANDTMQGESNQMELTTGIPQQPVQISQTVAAVASNNANAVLSFRNPGHYTHYFRYSKMAQDPQDHHNLSLSMSNVLNSMGINQWVVSRKQRSGFLYEMMSSMFYNFHAGEPTPVYLFGSEIEGTTHAFLRSDRDMLMCKNKIEVIQEMCDWRQGQQQYLMVRRNATTGYCLLQKVRPDVPQLATGESDENHIKDSSNYLLLKHSAVARPLQSNEKLHGPAIRFQSSTSVEFDQVLALYCRSWPHEAWPWLESQNDGWPSRDIKRYARDHGCFLVPVSSKASANPDLEWRISTSLAERRLMLSLNITQLRCYVLMKMILIAHVKPKFGDLISSFMCKCILLHCIARSKFQDWQDHTLVTCLLKCLKVLLKNIQSENCPHFFIPGNNLLAGKIKTEAEKQELGEILTDIMGRIGQLIPDLSDSHIYFLSLKICFHIEPAVVTGINRFIIGEATLEIAGLTGVFISLANSPKLKYGDRVPSIDNKKLAVQLMLRHFILNGRFTGKIAYCLLAPIMCSMIGSSLASDYIQNSRALTPEVMDWFKIGLFDATSSKLRLASVFYCAQEFGKCKTILNGLCRLLKDTRVINLCQHNSKMTKFTKKRRLLCYEKDELQLVKDHIAYCVQFQDSERHCAPREFQYEMFRSTKEDLQFEFWMDLMVVDSLTYLYFLQYKLYKQLHNLTKMLAALTKLIETIDTKKHLCHRETALNLLGKCMEEENRNDVALKCYVRSLIIRPKNNAAKWHTSLLLFSIFKKNKDT